MDAKLKRILVHIVSNESQVRGASLVLVNASPYSGDFSDAGIVRVGKVERYLGGLVSLQVKRRLVEPARMR